MDAEILGRISNGDEQALGEIYDQFAGIIYGMAVRVTRDKHCAEDVTQDVFMYLWQNPSQYDESRGSLKTWLCTIAHSRAIDRVRHLEAQRKRDTQHAYESQLLQMDDDVAIYDVIGDDLENALKMLPPEQAQAIHLAYFDGQTYRQVAQILNIPEGTAKSRIRLGLRRLVEALEDKNTAGASS